MREFLKNIHVVGATMAFREGDLVRYCIDDLLRHCDRVLVQLDNSDEATEEAVGSYGDRIRTVRSGYPRLDDETDGRLKRRLNSHQDEIRDRLLRELGRMNRETPIDLLMWPDGDEVFTDWLWQEHLTEFWENDAMQVLFTGSVTPFERMDIARSGGIVSHARIFKYRPDMTAIPYRSRCFYRPFDRSEAYKVGRTMVHLALLTEESREFRKLYLGTGRPDRTSLWKMPDDVRRLAPSEIRRAFRRPPVCTTQQYYEDPERYKRLFA